MNFYGLRHVSGRSGASTTSEVTCTCTKSAALLPHDILICSGSYFTDASRWRQIGRQLYWVKHLNTQTLAALTSQSEQSDKTVSCLLARRKKKEAMLRVSATYLHKMSHKTHSRISVPSTLNKLAFSSHVIAQLD